MGNEQTKFADFDPSAYSVEQAEAEKKSTRSKFTSWFKKSRSSPTATQSTSNTNVSAIITADASRGQKFGNFEVLGELGKGAQGAVFSAKNLETNEIVALKVISTNLQKRNNPEFIKALMAKLQHENIVQLRDCFSEKDAYGFDILISALEFCDGKDLADKIKRVRDDNNFIDEEWIMKWFIEICRGVEHMHSQNIFHRDLKPENIFLTKQCQVKIGDLDLSKDWDDVSERGQTVLGTREYMAPELFIAKIQDYTWEVDIWALAGILFELATPSPSLFELIRQGDSPLSFVAKPLFDTSDTALADRTELIRAAAYQALPTHFSEEFKKFIVSLFEVNPKNRISVQQILAHPLVKKFEAQLKANPVAVDEKMSEWTNARTFKWNNNDRASPCIHYLVAELLKKKFDVIVVPIDEGGRLTGGLAGIVAKMDPDLKLQLQQQLQSQDGNIKAPLMSKPYYCQRKSTSPEFASANVIFVLGPAISTAHYKERLIQLMHNCVTKAAKNNAKSIAFPVIGSGGAHIPIKDCATSFFRAVIMLQHKAKSEKIEPSSITDVYLICRTLDELTAFDSGYIEQILHIKGFQPSNANSSSQSMVKML